jgi:hypothetical protein
MQVQRLSRFVFIFMMATLFLAGMAPAHNTTRSATAEAPGALPNRRSPPTALRYLGTNLI